MKRLYLIIIIALLGVQVNLFAQDGGVSIGKGDSDADPSALLELFSKTKGLLIPRLSSSEREGISSPASGLLVYDSSLKGFYYWTGSNWKAISGINSGTGTTLPGSGGEGDLFYNTSADNLFVYANNGWKPAGSSKQVISLDEMTLKLLEEGTENGSEVDLSVLFQELSLDGTTLSISDGNSIDLSSVLVGDMLKSVYDSDGNNSVDNADKVNGLTVETPVPAGAVFTDSQTLSVFGSTLSITGGNSVTLPSGGTGTDSQTLSVSGNTLSISNGNSVSLPTGGGTGDMTQSVYDSNTNSIVDNAEKVNNLSVETAVPSGAVFTDNQTLTEVLGAGNDAGGTAITNLAAPTNDLDAATKKYVDGNAQNVSEKDQAGGYVGLGVDGKISATYLPGVTLNNAYTVVDEGAQLDLSPVQGDIAIRTDVNKSYVYNGGNAGDMTDWTELLFTSSVTSVNGETGNVDIGIADITNLQSNLDSKVDKPSGQNDKILTTDGTGTLVWVDKTTYTDTDNQTAAEVTYDNTTSGLTATDVKAAIDEVASGSTDDQTAAEVSYDNSTSGLTATDVNAAVNELKDSVDLKINSTDLATVATSGSYNDLSDQPTISDDQTAAEVTYDNTTSGLTATDVKAAIDEVASGSTDDQTAAEVSYDNSTSGLTATDVNAAVNELKDSVDLKINSTDLATVATSGSYNDLSDQPTISDDQTAAEVTYDNTTSGLTATDVKAAIDEVASGSTDDQTAAEVSYDNSTSGLTATDVNAAVNELKDSVDLKINSTDLATVATSGSYSDLSDKPTITDDQSISDLSLSGTTLQLTLEGDANGQQTVDLSGLQDGTGTDNQTAAEVTYDNTTSGLTATDVKAAIDEVASGSTDDQTAAEVSYDNSTSGLTATDVNAAVNELKDSVDLKINSTDLATVATSGSYSDLSDKPTITDDQSISDLSLSGTTLQLALEGDANGQQTVDLSGLQDGTGTDNQTAAEVTYDNTISGLTATDVKAAVDELKDSVDLKINSTDLATVATSGSYNDLSDKPTITDDQSISDLSLSGTTLQLTLEGDANGQQTVDLSGLQDGTGTDNQTAAEVTYDNTTSGLTATDVKAAIDEVASGSTDDQTAAEVSYDNSTSGLTATDVNAAVNELKDSVDLKINSTDLATVATSGSYSDLSDKPTITDDQSISDLSLSGTTLQLTLEGDANGQQTVDLSGLQDGTGTDNQTAAEVTYDNTTSGLTATDVKAAVDELKDSVDLKINSTDLATVATSGSYNDLSDQPTITDDQDATEVVLSSGYVIPASGGALVAGEAIETSLGKLEKGLESAVAGGGEENVQVDWSETDTGKDAYIKNKPTIPDVSGLATTIELADSTAQVRSELTSAKLDTSLTSGHLFIGNADGKAVEVALSGDATIDATGKLSLAKDSVTTIEIKDSTILSADIARDAVTSLQLKGQPTADPSAGGSTGTYVLKSDYNGGFGWVDITSGVPTDAGNIGLTQGSILIGGGDGKATELEGKADGQILIGNGTTVASQPLSGDATLDKTGQLTIANNAVNSDKISDGTITAADLSSMSATNGQVMKWDETNNIWAASDDNDSNTSVADSLTSDSSSDALSAKMGKSLKTMVDTKLDSTLASGNLFVGDAAGKAAGVTLSGDATIDATGKLSLAKDSVTTTEIKDGTILAADLSSMSATNGQVMKWDETNNIWAASDDNDSNTSVADSLTSDSSTDALSAKMGKSLKTMVDTKLDSTLASGNLFVGDAAGKAAGVTLSGDATIDATGKLSLAKDSVTTTEIKDGTILAADLSSMSATNGQVMKWDGSTWAASDDNDSNTSVADSLTSDSSSDALSAKMGKSLKTMVDTKLDSTLASGNLFVGDAAGKAAGVTLSGDATIDATGLLSLKADSVTTTEIKDGTILAVDLSSMSATNGQVMKWDETNNIWAASDDNDSNTSVADSLTSDSSSDALSAKMGKSLKAMVDTKLDSTLASGNLFVGDAAGKAAGVTLSGDATIDATGKLSLAKDSVTTTEIKDGTILAEDLSSMSATNGQVMKWDETNNIWAASDDNDSNTSVADSLTSDSSTDALSAKMGKSLKAIVDTKLDSTLASGNLFVGDAAGKAAGVTLSGDATIDATGKLSLKADSVTTTEIKDGTILAEDLSSMSATNGQVMKWDETNNIWAASDDNDSNTSVADSLTSDSSSDALSAKMGKSLKTMVDTKLDSTLASGNLFVGDAAGKAVGVTLSGDATIDETGKLTISDGAVTSNKIGDNEVKTANLNTGSVVSAKIYDGTIATEDLADGAITADKIFDGTITAADLSSMGATVGQVMKWDTTGVDHWVASSIQDSVTTIIDDLTTGGTTEALSAEMGKSLKTMVDAKLDSTLASGNLFVGDADGKAAGVELSGDATIDATGLLSLKADSVTTTEIKDSTILSADIARNAVTSLQLKGQPTADPSAGGSTGTYVLKSDYNGGFGWVDITSGVPTDAGNIGLTQGSILIGGGDGKATELEAKANGQILIGNGTTVASQPLSGDATIDATGKLSLAKDSVTTTEIKNGTILTEDLADNAVAIAKIGTSGVGDANRFLTTDGNGDPQWEAKTNLAQTLSEVLTTDNDANGAAITNLADPTNNQDAATKNYVDTLAQHVSEKNQPNGYVGLGSDGKISTSYLPGVTLNSVSTMSTEEAQLGLSAVSGDIAIRTDQNKSYVFNGGTAGDMSDWNELLYTSAVTSVNGKSGNVTVDIADISKLDSTLNSKISKPDGLNDKILTTAGDGSLVWADKSSFSSSTLNDSQILIGNASNEATAVSLTGDATISNTGVLSLKADSVTTTEIKNGTILAEDIANQNISAQKIAGITSNGTAGQVLSSKADGSFEWADGLTSTLDSAKLFIGNNSNVATGVALSGDANIDETGKLTISDGAITSNKIGDNEVKTANLNTGSVVSAKIYDGTIATEDLADGAITADKIFDGTITAADLSSMSATNGQVMKWDGSTWAASDDNDSNTSVADSLTSDSSSDALSAKMGKSLKAMVDTKLDSTLASGNLFVGDAAGKAAGVTLSGDATIDATGKLSLAKDSVTTTEIKDGTILAEDLSQMSATNGQVMKWDGSTWAASDDNDSNTSVADSLTSDSSTDALSAKMGKSLKTMVDTKLDSTLASGNLFVGDAAGKAAGVTLSGDATIDATGLLSLKADSVTTTEIKDGTILAEDIADQNISAQKIAGITSNGTAGQVLSSKADGSFEWADGLTSTLDSAKLFIGNNSNVATGVALSGDANIDETGKLTISDGAITSNKIGDNEVKTANLNTGSVVSAKIYDGTIATEDLADGAITADKIFDGTITAADLSSMSATNGQVMKWDGSTWAASDDNDSNTSVADSLTSDSSSDALSAKMGKSLKAMVDTKLDSTLASGNLFVGDAAGKAAGVTLSGDATIDATGKLSLAKDSVTTTEIKDGTILAEDLSQMSATNGQVMKWDGSTWAASDDNDSNTSVADSLTSDSSTDALSAKMGKSLKTMVDTKLDSTLASGNLFVGDAAGKAAGVTLSGDATIDATGLLSLKADSVTTTEIKDGTILAEDIADQNINAQKIAGITSNGTAGQVLSSKADGSFEWADGLTSTLDSAKLFIGSNSNVATGVALSGDATIDNTGKLTISDGAITSGKIGNLEIKAANLNIGSVTSVKILDGTITAADLSQMGATVGQVMKWDTTGVDGWVASTIQDSVTTIIDDLTTGGSTEALSAEMGKSLKTMVDAKLDSTLDSGNLFVGDATGKAAGVALSGDATIDATGKLSLANDSVKVENIGTAGASDANKMLTTDASGDPQWSAITNITNGTTANNTLYWDGTAWAESDALTNNGTDVATSGKLTVSGDTINFSKGGAIHNRTATTLEIKADTLNTTGNLYVSGGDISTARIDMRGTDGYLIKLRKGIITGDRTINFPDADGTVALTKDVLLKSLNTGKLLVGSASNTASEVTISGDATMDADGKLTLANDSVKVENIGTAGATDANKILTTDTNGDPQWEARSNFASASLTQGSILVGNSAGEATAMVANADGQILIGDGNDLVSVDVAGEIDIDNTGVATIADGVVDDANLASNAVITDKIADNAVTIDKIGTDGATDANKILTTDTNGDPQWSSTSAAVLDSSMVYYGFATVTTSDATSITSNLTAKKVANGVYETVTQNVVQDSQYTVAIPAAWRNPSLFLDSDLASSFLSPVDNVTINGIPYVVWQTIGIGADSSVIIALK